MSEALLHGACAGSPCCRPCPVIRLSNVLDHLSSKNNIRCSETACLSVCLFHPNSRPHYLGAEEHPYSLAGSGWCADISLISRLEGFQDPQFGSCLREPAGVRVGLLCPVQDARQALRAVENRDRCRLALETAIRGWKKSDTKIGFQCSVIDGMTMIH